MTDSGTWTRAGGAFKGRPPVPYKLDRLASAPPGELIWLCPDEDLADALTGIGLCSTAAVSSAVWLDSDWLPYLKGRRVAVLARPDELGLETGQALALVIATVAADVRVIDPPGLQPSTRGATWVASWASVATASGESGLASLLDGLWNFAERVEAPTLAVFPADDDDSPPVADLWPKLGLAAWQGLAGELVDLIDPETEADPVATLAQVLVGFANLVGRGPHFRVGATRHHLNLFVALVGATAAGRKGTSWDLARWALGVCDPAWEGERIASGLVSGEGLIHHVRDPVSKQGSVVDEGVCDKRLLVVETEMSRALKAMNRESNTLSDVIRQAWDSGNLRTLGKIAPARATDAHISIIAHTTQADVRHHLSQTDAANGFANRFLWLAVRRSKLLPEGGHLDTLNFGTLSRRMTEAVEFARSCGVLTRNPAAKELWASVYPTLSEGRPGLLGAVTSRAEAQTMRIACVYAVLGRQCVVGPDHLEAALALWRYAEDSARLTFGESLGDPNMDRLIAALKASPAGLTRKEISRDVFASNRKSADLARNLADLLTAGRVHRIMDKSTGGRPSERWFSGPSPT